MRIIQPKRKRKPGSKANPSLSSKQSPDFKIESGDFACDEKPNKSAYVSEPHYQATLDKPQKTQPPQFSDGRKRRRSEFSDVSFFTNSAKPETTHPEVTGPSCDKVNVLPDDQLAQLLEPLDDTKKEFNRLLASGMRLLAMREHSVKEISNKLLAKTESPDVAYAVIDELVQNKYLSDERFAESFVRSRSNKGFGPIKIRSELKNKGVANHLIAEYLDMNSAIWFDSARELHQKKYGNVPLEDYKGWAKRARFMQSRGFTMEHIQVTLPELEFD